MPIHTAHLVRPLLPLAALGLLAPSLDAGWSVFEEGHLDLRFIYDLTPGSGLEVLFYDVNRDELFAPDETTLRVKGHAAVARPVAAAWDPTGSAAGAAFWVLPQSLTSGLLWLGTRAAIADEVFRPLPPAPVFGTGQLSLRLLAVEGSGPDAGGKFSLYSTDAFGFPSFAWSTADGIDEDDRIAPLNTRSHTHYNWAFSQPGDYLLTFEVTGYTRTEGVEVTTQATVHFQVLPVASVPGTALRWAVDDRPSTLHWQRPSGEAPVIIWRSENLERWWIEAVVEEPGTRLEVTIPAIPMGTAFWRAGDPLSTP